MLTRSGPHIRTAATHRYELLARCLPPPLPPPHRQADVNLSILNASPQRTRFEATVIAQAGLPRSVSLQGVARSARRRVDRQSPLLMA